MLQSSHYLYGTHQADRLWPFKDRPHEPYVLHVCLSNNTIRKKVKVSHDLMVVGSQAISILSSYVSWPRFREGGGLFSPSPLYYNTIQDIDNPINLSVLRL